MPVRAGLELWLDVSRQSAGRGAHQLPSLTAGNSVDYLLDGSGNHRHLAQPSRRARPKFQQSFAGGFIRFDGEDDFLFASHLGRVLTNTTIFLVAAPRANKERFLGFFSMSEHGKNDYTSGLNLDLGFEPTPKLSAINIEGAGSSGAQNLLAINRVLDFNTWHCFTISSAPGDAGTALFLDGVPQQARERSESLLHLDELTLGARYYSNEAEPPFVQGFLDFDFAELLIFGRALTGAERGLVEKYLENKYAVLRSLPPVSAMDGSAPLVTVTNAPPIQMLVPGFQVDELPVRLNNINNVRYRADGKLVALGYNGHVYLLADSDDDGLEDKVTSFWDADTIRTPIGLALTPPGYRLGQGVFIAGKGKISLLVDTNGDDRADQEIVAATWNETSEQQGVDALGVAVDREGNLFFSLGAASFTGAYLIDKATGESRYRLGSERGTILKVSPDFQRREIVCTGIRFAVGLAFNGEGDLFCTDQEGATWLPNGNPLDELLHIVPGRHYGFPPRHPKYLPGVIDEPSLFEYAPQHESTCGLAFNEPVNGGPTFGPARWRGDAWVAGYSRGKLYRTRLAKGQAGYVAQNQLIASLQSLPVDACISPAGDLLVATHSGKPDWGSGPNGIGHLYRILYAEKDWPQPALAWSSSPAEIRVAFDAPLDPRQLKNLAAETTITQGKYVFAGDRFETIRPGYQVVHDQLSHPRFSIPVFSVALSADQQTLIFATPPRETAVNYSLTIPGSIVRPAVAKTERPSAGGPNPGAPPAAQIDLLTDLNGLEADWESNDRSLSWHGWLPHPNLQVSRRLTAGSAEHARLWDCLQKPGVLRLRGQLDLWQMLQPAIQPGSKLDYERPVERVSVVFSASVPFTVTSGTVNDLSRAGSSTIENGFTETLHSAAGPNHTHSLTITQPGREDQWWPFDLRMATGSGETIVDATWSTSDDSRSRPFPLRRLLLPWASPTNSPVPLMTQRAIPEIAGGRWLRGRRIFFGDTVACHKCHQIRGEGQKVGPDLSNLIYRDYASVFKDIREPSAAINPDHAAYLVTLKNGDSLTAVPRAETAEQISFVDALGAIIRVAKTDVASIKPSPVSLMPEGLDKGLAAGELKDLMTFLLVLPLEPAPLEIKNEPPPRTRTQFRKAASGPTLAGPGGGKSDPFRPFGKAAPPGAFPILLCAGPKDHGPGEHDYPLWMKRWSKLLALADEVTVDTAQNWPSADQMSRAAVLVFYSDNPAWDAAHARELDAFLARGGGAVFIHYAVDGHNTADQLAQRIGLAWRGGVSKFRHGPLDLKFQSHPLAPAVADLELVDESYWNLVGDESGVNILATGLEEGQARPLLWTRQQGPGRIFVSIPGHYTWTFDDPVFRLALLRGISWAGGQPMDRLSELATIGARLADEAAP